MKHNSSLGVQRLRRSSRRLTAQPQKSPSVHVLIHRTAPTPQKILATTLGMQFLTRLFSLAVWIETFFTTDDIDRFIIFKSTSALEPFSEYRPHEESS